MVLFIAHKGSVKLPQLPLWKLYRALLSCASAQLKKLYTCERAVFKLHTALAEVAHLPCGLCTGPLWALLGTLAGAALGICRGPRLGVLEWARGPRPWSSDASRPPPKPVPVQYNYCHVLFFSDYNLTYYF